MMAENDQGSAVQHGDHEGAGSDPITRRAAIIGGAVVIGGVAIGTPESLALSSRKMRRAQEDIAQAIRVVRSSRVSKNLRAKTLPDLLQAKAMIDRNARAEIVGGRRTGARARAAQADVGVVLCPTLRAVRNAFVGSPAAASILPILDRLLATFGCSTGPTGHDVLATWVAAWNEPDQAARAQLLARSLAKHAELVDPIDGRFKGRDAINERIGGFLDRFPGARLTLASGVDEHNGFARYAWAINAADGSLIEGIDVVERDDDNRLRRVVMFFGPLPAVVE